MDRDSPAKSPIFYFFQLLLEVFSASIVVQPNMGMCEDFTDDNGGRRHRSIMLNPVKVRMDGGDFTLTWTCSLAENYHNKECFLLQV